MPVPIIANVGQAVSSLATNALQTAVPAPVVAGVDVIQQNQEKKTEKIKQEVRDTTKNVDPKKIEDAKKTVDSIVRRGVNVFNPFNVLTNLWYMLVDILPIKHSSDKILADNLEIIRNPKQTRDFQSKAMDVFREHLKILDLDMQRMGSKPAIYNLFPFSLLKKQNAEEERTLAEKTKYLAEITQSLDGHLSFIQETMLTNTVQRHTGFTDSQGFYQAQLTTKDFRDLKRFSAELSDGKYSRLNSYPPMQAVKAKVDNICEQLKPVYDGFAKS